MPAKSPTASRNIPTPDAASAFLDGKASGGTTPIVNRSKWESIFIPLPPLAEQERIVAKLEKLMKFCDELEANIRQGKAHADQLLQTALKEALEPREEYKLTA